MSQVLQLESFRRAPAPEVGAPTFSADDVARARAEGEAAGRDAATDAALGRVTEALAELAQALRDEDRRREALRARALDEIGRLTRVLTTTLAGGLRGDVIASRILDLLRDDAAAGDAQPAVIRCEAAAAGRLAEVLAATGLSGIAVRPAPIEGAEYALDDGVVRVSPDRLVAQLQDIIAEIGAQDERGET